MYMLLMTSNVSHIVYYKTYILNMVYAIIYNSNIYFIKHMLFNLFILLIKVY